MTDDEFLGLAYEISETEVEPAYTAGFTRTYDTYSETMTISAYPVIRTIVVTHPEVEMRPGHTMPGAIRDIPLGWRDMRDEETVRSRFERVVHSYVEQGWVREYA